MFFIMFYNSNLRQFLILPTYQPEINNDEDLLDLGIKTIYTDTPHEWMHDYFGQYEVNRPELYFKVSDSGGHCY